MALIHYLAYGSNLHPARLAERAPSAQLLGITKVPGYRLVFHKRGKDDSGKGHIHLTGKETDCFYGAIYAMHAAHKADLDAIEGDGYASHILTVQLNNLHQDCFVYMAGAAHLDTSLKPYEWYKSLIVLGAKFHNFPQPYIDNIQRTACQEDPDPDRRKHNEQLIARIQPTTTSV